MSVASSHQISTSNQPSVPAQLVTKATRMASEMSVIIPGWRARTSASPPRRKTVPPYRKMTVPRIGGMRSLPGKSGAV